MWIGNFNYVSLKEKERKKQRNKERKKERKKERNKQYSCPRVQKLVKKIWFIFLLSTVLHLSWRATYLTPLANDAAQSCIALRRRPQKLAHLSGKGWMKGD